MKGLVLLSSCVLCYTFVQVSAAGAGRTAEFRLDDPDFFRSGTHVRLAEGQITGVAQPAVLTFYPVYFVQGQSHLTNYTKNKLANLLDLLLKHPEYRVRIYGHTDNLLSDEESMELSEQRVESVVQFLTGMGLSRSRIAITAGLGKTCPAFPNTSEANRKLNRRVEFELFVDE
ncbi:OmpA family protein [Gaoshiqia sp. Z1-71]|uniref:OmpA family protein n=1 Tax=Gaoshiqia hydrogeniformans TaxID=3290090 RepID=UPI003BF7BD06